jgi:hypothetical protein
MPWLIAILINALIAIAGTIAGRVLLALGMGYVSYTGISFLLDGIKALVVGQLQSAPSNMVVVMSLLKIDVCINILFSALAARWALQGLASGKVTRMVIK